ncbi:hypothetical protein SUGI_0941240 [Cryptomeria japonica]|nr:hypothetical protein SUGI_0941240 [Cryptomeria japonica]
MPSLTHPNFSIRALSKEGHLKEALHILLTTHNPPVNSATYIQLLQSCIAKNSFCEGADVWWMLGKFSTI